MQIVGIIMCFFVSVLQYVNFSFVFFNIKFLDLKLKRCKNDVSSMDAWINTFIATMYVICIIIFFIIRNRVEDIEVIVYGMILIMIGLEAVLDSFISLYVKVRYWYYTEPVCIKTKTNGIVFDNVLNYKNIDNRVYEFVCKKEGKLRRFKIPISDVELIEHTINTDITYLDNYRD